MRFFRVLPSIISLGLAGILCSGCGGGNGERPGGANELEDQATTEGTSESSSPTQGAGSKGAAQAARSTIIVGTASGDLQRQEAEVRIKVLVVPEKSLLALGETASVRVEVENAGPAPLGCAKAVHDALSVYLELLYRENKSEYIRIQKEYFASILEKTRSRPYLPVVTLAPGEKTSTVLRFILPEAGTYRVRGVYRGFGPSNLLFFRSEWTEITVRPDKEATSLRAIVHTDLGEMEFAFHPEDALATTIHFLTLVSLRFYDNTHFHRVEKGFVIQAGDPGDTGLGGPGFFIPQEFNRRPHLEGAVSMVRRSAHVDTAGSQFFICFLMDPENQKLLDGQYTVFGRVARGFDTAQKIANVPVNSAKRPIERIRITRVTLEKK